MVVQTKSQGVRRLPNAYKVTYAYECLQKQVKEFYSDFSCKFGLKGINAPFGEEEFVQHFNFLRNRMLPGTNLRSLRNLGVIALFTFLKIKRVLIPLPKLLRYYHLKYNDFVTRLNKALANYPEFARRDRKGIVEAFVCSVLNRLELGEIVVQNALVLFKHLYPYFVLAKEEVAAALVCVLALIASDVKSRTISEVCEEAGIKQSSLDRFFKAHAVPHLQIENYTTLARSAKAIRKGLTLKFALQEVKGEAVSKKRLRRFAELPLLMAKVVDLGCSGMSSKEIADKVNLSEYKVKRILDRKLSGYKRNSRSYL